MTAELSLEIISNATLADIERALDTKGDVGSRSRGDALPGGRMASTSVLRIEPECGGDAPLQRQMDAIRARLPPKRLRAANIAAEATFSVAVYFDTANATTIVPPELIAAIHEYGATVEIAAYPVADPTAPRTPA